METSLHRDLKLRYAESSSQTEITIGRYRIDAIRGDELIEIQHGSLGAIRDKIARLLRRHRVTVVKPIVSRKRLVKRAAKGKRVVAKRMSPKRGTVLNLFEEMVHFCRVFPHRNLTLEVPLVDIEEWRFPGHGRRRWRRARDHQVEDQKLLAVQATYCFRTAEDLASLLPDSLPSPFHTRHLAETLAIDGGFARQIAYSLRETKGITQVGKHGNFLLYVRPD